MWPRPLPSPMSLTLDFKRSNFEIAVSQELLVWLWNKKESNQLDTRLTVWPYPLTIPIPWLFKVKVWPYLGNGRADWHGKKWVWIVHDRDFGWGEWMYGIVTGLTSDVGVLSTSSHDYQLVICTTVSALSNKKLTLVSLLKCFFFYFLSFFTLFLFFWFFHGCIID